MVTNNIELSFIIIKFVYKEKQVANVSLLKIVFVYLLDVHTVKTFIQSFLILMPFFPSFEHSHEVALQFVWDMVLWIITFLIYNILFPQVKKNKVSIDNALFTIEVYINYYRIGI